MKRSGGMGVLLSNSDTQKRCVVLRVIGLVGIRYQTTHFDLFCKSHVFKCIFCADFRKSIRMQSRAASLAFVQVSI